MTDTETKWSNRVQEWKASGKTAEEFAEGKGFEPSTLRFWASKLRQGKTSPVTERAPRVRMARVTPTTLRSDDTLVVVVGAARVAVRAGFDVALLRQVVAALGGAI
jgi:transposase